MGQMDTTALDDDDIIAALEGMKSWNGFARSLLQQHNSRGDLSPKQWAAAERMIVKVRENDAKRAKFRTSVDVSAIQLMFRAATDNGLKRPAFRCGSIKLSLAGPASKNAGAIYVKRDGDYCGKIVAGQFMPTSKVDAETVDLLKQIAKNPLGMAVAHGREFGTCSCCGRTLTNKVSIDLGIGPVCRERWGI